VVSNQWGDCEDEDEHEEEEEEEEEEKHSIWRGGGEFPG
jgi:hypothetical protein